MESGELPTAASRSIGFHPGPDGLTSVKNFTNVSSLAGGATYVTVIHTSVVTATVTSSEMCGATSSPVLRAMKKPSATTNELAMAAISLHAFTRHQNQRSR